MQSHHQIMGVIQQPPNIWSPGQVSALPQNLIHAAIPLDVHLQPPQNTGSDGIKQQIIRWRSPLADFIIDAHIAVWSAHTTSHRHIVCFNVSSLRNKIGTILYKRSNPLFAAFSNAGKGASPYTWWSLKLCSAVSRFQFRQAWNCAGPSSWNS